MKKISVLLISLVIMLTSCKDENGKEIAAELNTGNITVSEFEKSMLENVFKNDFDKAVSSSIDQRRDYLRQMAYRKIIIDLVSKEKIDTLEAVRNEYNKRLYEYSIINGLIPDSVRSKIYNEEDIKAHYGSKKFRYSPKHILIDTKKHGESTAKAKIDSIYERITNGENFENLAKKYSDDIKTGVEGGKLGTVFLHDLVKEFREKLSGMEKGEISEPFKTVYGYHVVYLEDITENKGLRDFEREKKDLISELDRIHSVEFNE
ncbi:MAG: peptidylprolyl isomerase, partial [Candidatus Delongbacteria bacterium]|nr:peptidylprolyl isomerase [Candidatus Delongbacteria bacterium]